MEALKVAICFCLVGISTQTYTIQLTNDHDVIYRGKVSVGTPPQEFEAVYHTGTTLTYFPAKGCKASGRFPHACDANKTYDPHASRTSRYWQTFSTQGTLYSNYKASGRDYYDTLTFKDKHTGKELVVKNADVGAASMVWGFGHAVVGLGNQARTYTVVYSNSTFAEMNHNGLTSMMTVALRKCDRKLCEDGGAITFGGFDNKNCKPGIQWVQAIKGSTRWVFHLDLIRLNGRFLPSSYRVSADADTGNSYIQFSRKMIPTVARLLKAKKQGFYYTTDCNAKFTLGFVIRKKNFEVTEKHLLLNQQINGKCVLAIAEYPSIENFVVLGSAFHRAVCVTYEVQRGKLGFTPTVDQ